MEQQVTLDAKAFKALSAETRINILKLLSKRRYLQSEIAEMLSLKVPTVKEHMDALMKAGLIRKLEEGRKWKYFELTEKANAILHPEQRKIFFVIAALVFVVIIGGFGIIKQFLFAAGFGKMAAEKAVEAEPMLAAKALGDGVASGTAMGSVVSLLVALAVIVSALLLLLVYFNWKNKRFLRQISEKFS